MAKTARAESASMQERLLKEGAEGWTPEPGDTLIGVVDSIKASQPNEYGIYPIVTLVLEDNSMVAVHCFHSILKGRLLEKRPAPGERIAILYSGEKESKKADSRGVKRTYHNYAVVVDRPTDTEAQAAWDTFAVEDDETSVD